MSELSEQARSKAKSKVERLTGVDPKERVDASGYTPPNPLNGNVQTGMRVLSRRQFKRGGMVAGEKSAMHAGRKPRKSGGALTAESLINRNVRDANEDREGTKQTGGFKRGGTPKDGRDRAHKFMGGPMAGQRPMPAGVRPVMRASGGGVHGSSCSCAKCSGGRVGKAAGGSATKGKSLDGTLQGLRPEGGRLARKGGGRAKKGMNVNIIIAPQGSQKPAMPPAGPPPAGGPVGLHQGMPPQMPPGAAPPMGPQGMPPQMRKRGGRTGSKAYPIETGAGGGLGRLEKIQAYG